MVPQLQEECLIRKGDNQILDQLCRDLNLNLMTNTESSKSLSSPNYQYRSLTSRKIQILLNSYIKRHKFILSRPLVRNDLIDILRLVMDLLFAMVDISSSYGWINTCLRIMELSQMLVQAISNPVNDKLMQLSMSMNKDRIRIFKESGVTDIYDLINMNDDDRDELLTEKLSLSEKEISQIAQKKSRFRNSTNTKNGETQRLFECNPESELTLSIDISRDFSSNEEEDNDLKNQNNIKDQEIYPCIVKNLNYYPLEKEENWWVILIKIGVPNLPKENSDDENEDEILSIRRIQLNKISNQVLLKFNSIEDSGMITNYRLLVICDSYIGCDQEFMFSVKTVEY
ncbi:hypothetical protein CHM_5g2980 [Cryptosporidium hominis]